MGQAGLYGDWFQAADLGLRRGSGRDEDYTQSLIRIPWTRWPPQVPWWEHAHLRAFFRATGTAMLITWPAYHLGWLADPSCSYLHRPDPLSILWFGTVLFTWEDWTMGSLHVLSCFLAPSVTVLAFQPSNISWIQIGYFGAWRATSSRMLRWVFTQIISFRSVCFPMPLHSYNSPVWCRLRNYTTNSGAGCNAPLASGGWSAQCRRWCLDELVCLLGIRPGSGLQAKDRLRRSPARAVRQIAIIFCSVQAACRLAPVLHPGYSDPWPINALRALRFWSMCLAGTRKRFSDRSSSESLPKAVGVRQSVTPGHWF